MSMSPLVKWLFWICIAWMTLSSLVAETTSTDGDVAKLRQLLDRYSQIFDSTVDNWHEKIEFVNEMVAVGVELIPEVGSLIANAINLIDTNPDTVNAVKKLGTSIKREFVRLQRVEDEIRNLTSHLPLAMFNEDISVPLKGLRKAVQDYLTLDGTGVTSVIDTLYSKCFKADSTINLPYIAKRMSTILTDDCNLSRGNVTHQLYSQLRAMRIESFGGTLSSKEIQQQKELIEFTYKVPIGLMENYLTEIDRRFSRSSWKWDGETIYNFSTLLSKIKSMLNDYNGGTECIVDLVFEKYDYKRIPVGQYALMVMQELETILMSLPICHVVLFGKDQQSELGKSYVADIMENTKPVLSQLREYIPKKWKEDAAKREELLLNQILDKWLEKKIDWKEEHGEPTATILSTVADIGMENYKRFVVLLPHTGGLPLYWERHVMGWHREEVKMISVEHQIGSAKIIRTTRHNISTSFDHVVADCVVATSRWLRHNYNNPDAWLELKVCDLKNISFIGASVNANQFGCDFEGQWASETWDTNRQLVGKIHEFKFQRHGFYWPWCWRMFFGPLIPVEIQGNKITAKNL